jgi:dissimilatory sulfite reductase (desulfoviridin) alpha/beta subunit
MEFTPAELDSLKKRGFLKQKQDGFVLFRIRALCGNLTPKQLEAMAEIARRFGKGLIHATTRQGMEVPHIAYADIPAVEAFAKEKGLLCGTSGPRFRTTTCCPGNNWCKMGLVDTFAMCEDLERAGFSCGLELPHKFKINVSGCPNTCTRSQHSEIGLHGAIDPITKQFGYVVYAAGCGGRTPRHGIKLAGVHTSGEVIALVAKVLGFFKAHAKPRQRLAALVEERGRADFFAEIGVGEAL